MSRRYYGSPITTQDRATNPNRRRAKKLLGADFRTKGFTTRQLVVMRKYWSIFDLIPVTKRFEAQNMRTA